MALNPFRYKITKDFDPKNLLIKFEDVRTAQFRARIIIETLGGFDDHKALVAKLSECRKHRRCGSAACPICLRRFRRGYCSQLASFMSSHQDYEWKFLTLVPPNLAFPVGGLRMFDKVKCNDRLHKQLSRSSLSDAIVLGGWDFSLQFRTADYQPRWRPHLHCVVGGAERGELQEVLKPHYPKDRYTLRPIKVVKVKETPKDHIRVATYSMKSTIDRSNNGMSRTSVYSKRHVLSCMEAADIYSMLDEMQFSGRLFRRNAPDGLNFRA